MLCKPLFVEACEPSGLRASTFLGIPTEAVPSALRDHSLSLRPQALRPAGRFDCRLAREPMTALLNGGFCEMVSGGRFRSRSRRGPMRSDRTEQLPRASFPEHWRCLRGLRGERLL